MTKAWEGAKSMRYGIDLNMDGKVCVVTGGASGIGRAAAFALVEHGCQVVLVDRDARALSQAQSQLQAAGLSVATRAVDVTKSVEVNDAAAWVAAQCGPADILLNCAGIAKLHTALDVSDDDWCKVMNVNETGTFFACRAFGGGMVARGSGSIINMGSMSGSIINRPQFAASYMTSKGAVHQLTRALAVEWAKPGVRVNALAPGYVATEMTLSMRAQPDLFDVWMDRTPMGRCAEPEEIVAAIVFLASSASSYITGAILPVDGGYTAC